MEHLLQCKDETTRGAALLSFFVMWVNLNLVWNTLLSWKGFFIGKKKGGGKVCCKQDLFACFVWRRPLLFFFFGRRPKRLYRMVLQVYLDLLIEKVVNELGCSCNYCWFCGV